MNKHIPLIHFIKAAIKNLCLVALPVCTSAQSFYSGSVVDKNSGKPVPYATVGLMKENTGINADENGNFKLYSKKFLKDTLIFSSVGFVTVKFPVGQFPSDHQFYLNENTVALKDIVIHGKYIKSEILNAFSDCGFDSYTTSGSTTQIAQLYHTASANSLLSNIEICKRAGNCLFRVRVYDMDAVSGLPSADLADTVIEINTAKKHVNIDLEKYQIVIPGQNFFIAVEWIFIPSNSYTVKFKRDGIKNSQLQYDPNIFSKTAKEANNNAGIYHKFYDGRWRQGQHARLLISAKVKY